MPLTNLPTTIVTVGPRVSVGARGGNWSVTRPSWPSHVGVLVAARSTLKPASRSGATAFGRRSPITFGTFTFCDPFETTIVTVEPGSHLGPASGDCAITCAGRRSSAAARVTCGIKPRLRIRWTAPLAG